MAPNRLHAGPARPRTPTRTPSEPGCGSTTRGAPQLQSTPNPSRQYPAKTHKPTGRLSFFKQPLRSGEFVGKKVVAGAAGLETISGIASHHAGTRNNLPQRALGELRKMRPCRVPNTPGIYALEDFSGNLA